MGTNNTTTSNLQPHAALPLNKQTTARAASTLKLSISPQMATEMQKHQAPSPKVQTGPQMIQSNPPAATVEVIAQNKVAPIKSRRDYTNLSQAGFEDAAKLKKLQDAVDRLPPQERYAASAVTWPARFDEMARVEKVIRAHQNTLGNLFAHYPEPRFYETDSMVNNRAVDAMHDEIRQVSCKIAKALYIHNGEILGTIHHQGFRDTAEGEGTRPVITVDISYFMHGSIQKFMCVWDIRTQRFTEYKGVFEHAQEAAQTRTLQTPVESDGSQRVPEPAVSTKQTISEWFQVKYPRLRYHLGQLADTILEKTLGIPVEFFGCEEPRREYHLSADGVTVGYEIIPKK